jgi:hypothetical protein
LAFREKATPKNRTNTRQENGIRLQGSNALKKHHNKVEENLIPFRKNTAGKNRPNTLQENCIPPQGNTSQKRAVKRTSRKFDSTFGKHRPKKIDQTHLKKTAFHLKRTPAKKGR